jgi:hypothetical protein
MDPISTAASIVLSKIVLDKFYEGVSSKLGEKAVETALAPIKALGKLLWDRCFKGKPGTAELVAQAEKGDAVAMGTLKEYLTKALEDQQFKAQVEPIVQQIHQTIVQFDDVNAENVMQVFGGQGLMVTAKQDQPIIQIQGNPTLNFGKSSD